MERAISLSKLRVPHGLEKLLVTLSREILRDKPINIYEYLANYFELLVKSRGIVDGNYCFYS